MGKTVTLRGQLILKENSLTEVIGNPILSYDATTGEITSRPAIAAGGAFVSTTLPSAQILVGNGSNIATAVAMTGDVTITNGGVTAIASGVIVNADVSGSAAIAYSKLNLATSIVNADVSGSAAIAYSKLNLSGSILNADVNASAAIARTKLASGTNYRILANNSSGVMSENAALTAARVIVSDANGQLVAATPTTTEINYVAGVTSAIQTQLTTTIAGNAAAALTQAPTATEDGFAITWDDGAQEWALTDPVIQGIPVAGSTRQFLGKNSGTNYDASWLSLVTTDISDITSTAAELNILDGVIASTAELNYVTGATSNLQTQIGTKLTNSLAQNAMWIGSPSNQASSLAPGTDGYVLTMAAGVPTWQAVVGTGTVTSIDVDGGTTGLTFSGGPVTTTGTITMAGTLDANNGGTGLAAYTIGDLLQANSSSTLAALAAVATGNVLRSGGVGTVSAWGKVTSSHIDATVQTAGLSWLLTGTSTIATPTITGKPTWTQSSESGTNVFQTFTQAAHTGGSPTGLLFTGGAHTTLAATTEAISVNYNLSATVQFTNGALATQRAFVIQAPTYAFTSASTLATAATFCVTAAPILGTNATFTDSYSILSQSGRVFIDGEGASTTKAMLTVRHTTSSGRLLINAIAASGNVFTVTQGGRVTTAGTITAGTAIGMLSLGSTITSTPNTNDYIAGVLLGGSIVAGGGSGATNTLFGIRAMPTFNGASTAAVVTGLHYDPTLTDVSGTHYASRWLSGIHQIKNHGTAVPTTPIDSVLLYAEDLSASSELFAKSEGNRLTQLSGGLYSHGSAGADYNNGVGIKNTSDTAEYQSRFLWVATSSASGNSDLTGTSLMPNDSVLTVTITGQGVAADGSEGISVVKTFSMRRDGSGTPVAIGSETSIHNVEDSGNTPTITLSVNSGDLRVTYSSGSATVYHWTIFADISITKV